MHKLNPTNHFLRKAKKLAGKNSRLRTCVEKTLSLLESDPFSKKLKTHKGVAEYDGKIAYSAFVTKDIRILWRFSSVGFELLDIIDIGGHSGKGKVYK